MEVAEGEGTEGRHVHMLGQARKKVMVVVVEAVVEEAVIVVEVVVVMLVGSGTVIMAR
jgi:hypothetical protein